MKVSPWLCLLVFLLTPSTSAAPAFGVAAHANVNIEWWYVNAHVTTSAKRHLALIGSFFRFGNGTSPFDGVSPAPRAHYLIYAVTDLDKKRQVSYSLVDKSMLTYVRQIAPLLAAARTDREAKSFVAALNAGRLPAPHQLLSGTPKIVNSPFRLAYGDGNTLTADNKLNTAFTMNLSGGTDKIHLSLTSQKPPMAVGGTGQTGLKVKSDMYYFSLTRCAVSGTIDTGTGPETVQSGTGWFDHQWGNSWVVSNNGWDWWGIQLDDGTDILCFRQRDLATGRVFFPLATFMDKNGKQTVTKKIVFHTYQNDLWTSPTTGARYPLRWALEFPDKNLILYIKASVPEQEMPVFGPGGSIWEGSCDVVTSYASIHRPWGALSNFAHGMAYMELVGYSSPGVKAKMVHLPTMLPVTIAPQKPSIDSDETLPATKNGSPHP